VFGDLHSVFLSFFFRQNKSETVVLKAWMMAESKGGATNIARLVSKQAGRAKEKVIRCPE
jgi:hypothetical protein